jgi:dethiobiotin synthetase
VKLFVTGSGTGVGKTWVTAALVAQLRSRGRTVAAVKPIETGCEPDAQDASLLAEACGNPALGSHTGFHRGRLPLAPWAAALEGEPSVRPTGELAQAILQATHGANDGIAEGAGGPLVPIDPERDVLDLMVTLGWPVLLVGLDGLGTLSHTLTAHESLEHRGLRVAAVVLTRQSKELSQGTNRTILEQRLPCPVWSVGPWTGPADGVAELEALASRLLRSSA